MSEITLRPYQQKFIDDVRHQYAVLKHAGKKLAVVGVAPCGAGKTIITGWMTRQSVARGQRSIFFVHRDELIAQTATTFNALDIPFGVIASGQPMHLDRPVQIASVQTLARRLDEVPAPNLLICDECHHILAKTYKKILDAYPQAYLLGVTATPKRMGGVNLGDVFDGLVESLSVQELIQLGNLTPFKYYAPDLGVNLDNVKITHGEFDNSELETVMSGTKIIGGIVENYQLLAAGKQAICYCVNVRHSQTVAQAFNDAGIRAAHVDGETPKFIRAQRVQQFRQGVIKVLCNCDLFGEGFDVPKCQAVILARPTRSLTLHVQQSMRSMRPDPDDPEKVAIIIDHVQNYLRHGKPDKRHFWSLDMKKITCPQCNRKVVPVFDDDGHRICPHCQFDFSEQPKEIREPQPKKERDLTEHDGNLVEISESDMEVRLARLKFEAQLRRRQPGWIRYEAEPYITCYRDCVLIAEACGYKPGAAYYLWQDFLARLKQNARDTD